ncbi:MAG TPA: glycosyl hydrolase family 65 protein [Anaerohalosphaeraceae bacterium]|nr:glycosyl hydrolase family 65 protein [Anaerohalosphaeraceae bacterium]HOL31027.1 glycosyl hydrolase family 65 protein [Anaerohalosphaeraceae bacterium]HOM75161.1 glycosyl hydrolase family 65 protein [Anaerohalosphaeraceae bacterium]HPC63543.1 glycosyl hydrolase family 65 protein [Anaerohalosphaeraceae bacterium]HPO70425.1 glycosyl hydrolase family 65 protein [Anaerohalosphaeraceae bacterium]
MHLTKQPEKYYGGDPWTVVEEGFQAEKQRLSESIFSVSNEYMGVRGYFEEGYSGDHLLGSYFNHLYDYLEIGHDQLFKGMVDKSGAMINAVDWLYTRIRIDGELLDLAAVCFSDFRRILDMKKLVYTRQFVWHLRSGRQVKITFIRFLSMHMTKIGCQRILLEPINFSGKADIVLGLDFNSRYEIASGWTQTQTTGSKDSDRGKNFWNEVKKDSDDTSCRILAQTKTTGFQLFSSFRMLTAQPVAPHVLEHDKFIGLGFSLSLDKNKAACIDKIVFNHWEKNDHTDENWKNACKLAAGYADVTFEAAYKQHVQFMEHVWDRFGVAIDGDDDVLQGLRFSILSCYQTYHGENPHLNPLCKGMTGEVYFGWAFWDTEIYCHRFHLFVNPQAAKNLLMYRYHTLDHARRRARDLDCRGARYPFATVSGYEDSGTWQHVDLEHHISGAVGYAIWQYDKITQDKDFLYREGIEMLLEISRFFASAGDYSPSNGDFGLYGVMGPDEFHMMVNHNFYTNYLAKKIFLYTLDVLEEMKANAPEQYKAAVQKVALDPAEPKAWTDMAQKMRIRQDPDTKIFEQHAGYFDLPHVEIADIPITDIPIYKNWAYIRIFRKNMIKQPDVLNHMFFFSEDFTLEEKKANYEFYESRTIHESSLSPSLHSILALEVGRSDQAYDFFKYAARLDLDNYNRNTEQGLHATSASGVWANLVCGYGGMRSDGSVLSFWPRIAKNWKGYQFNVNYRGGVIAVSVDKTKAVFNLIEGVPVKIKIYGRLYQIDPKGVQLPLIC